MMLYAFVKICKSNLNNSLEIPGGVVIINILDVFSQSFLPCRAEIVSNVLRLSRFLQIIVICIGSHQDGYIMLYLSIWIIKFGLFLNNLGPHD